MPFPPELEVPGERPQPVTTLISVHDSPLDTPTPHPVASCAFIKHDYRDSWARVGAVLVGIGAVVQQTMPLRSGKLGKITRIDQVFRHYPDGLTISYARNFGNSAGKAARFSGDKGMLRLGRANSVYSAGGGINRDGSIRPQKVSGATSSAVAALSCAPQACAAPGKGNRCRN